MRRKNPLVTGEYYHVFNKSIAGFRIFNNEEEFKRMLYLIRYYQWEDIPTSFSHFTRLEYVENHGLDYSLFCLANDIGKLVRVVAYCLMPTHIHLIVEQRSDKGVSIFMGNILNSYARYFNKKYRRLGPLWVGRFKNVLVKTDEEMLHLSRYLHLNPTTASLTKKPEDWTFSSYQEYLNNVDENLRICYWNDLIDVPPQNYKIFVNDQMGYQKELGIIRHLIFD